jgi:hypothetical protein
MAVFNTLQDLPIHWKDTKGVVHRCEGADVHPDVQLIWTLCRRDVPANESYLPKPPEDDPITCPFCRGIPR